MGGAGIGGSAAAVKQNLGGYDAMYELSLFTGAGGGLLGTHLLGWTPVGYVEYDDYCQRIIAQRIKDGFLPRAPIFGDVRTFANEGYAASYTGLVDVITAGFPCQPFSTAGKRAGVDDSRNMWPATIDIIRVVRPRFAFLENVPGLLSSGYFGTILGDLAESGYDARWRILSAAEMGAPHRRDRLWLFCTNAEHSTGSAEQKRQHERAEESIGSGAHGLEAGDDVADAEGAERQRSGDSRRWRDGFADGCEDVAYSKKRGLQTAGDGGGKKTWKGFTTFNCNQNSGWWSVEPDVG